MERSTFEATTKAFHDALRADDADALFVHVAEDVVLMPPGEAAVYSKGAMREWYAGFLATYRTASLVLSNPEVFVTDDWAVELGTYEWGLLPITGGDPLVDHGSYMQLWEKGADGQWLFAREIWNSSGPASPAPGA
jgi:ketosteroid isomerase-like protein